MDINWFSGVWLKHNLFKNVSKTQIQTIEYGLNDRDKKGRFCIDTLLIYTLWYEFSNDFDWNLETK